MVVNEKIAYGDKKKFYIELTRDLGPMLEEIWFTNLANACALVMANLPRINWAGFYLAEGKELFLGPFQGIPACLRIPFDRGVCGQSAREKRTLVVDDVHAFPGHIACDGRSRSEIVIPLLHDSRLIGVFDIDSPEIGRFNDADRVGLESIAKLVAQKSRWPETFLV